MGCELPHIMFQGAQVGCQFCPAHFTPPALPLPPSAGSDPPASVSALPPPQATLSWVDTDQAQSQICTCGHQNHRCQVRCWHLLLLILSILSQCQSCWWSCTVLAEVTTWSVFTPPSPWRANYQFIFMDMGFNRHVSDRGVFNGSSLQEALEQQSANFLTSPRPIPRR